MFPALAGGFFPSELPGKPNYSFFIKHYSFSVSFILKIITGKIHILKQTVDLLLHALQLVGRDPQLTHHIAHHLVGGQPQFVGATDAKTFGLSLPVFHLRHKHGRHTLVALGTHNHFQYAYPARGTFRISRIFKFYKHSLGRIDHAQRILVHGQNIGGTRLIKR